MPLNPPARPRTRPFPPPACVPAAAAAPGRRRLGRLPRAVVAEAGEIADPHRRYEARRALLELGLREGSTRRHPGGRPPPPPSTCCRPSRASRCCSTTRASSSTSSARSRPPRALFSAAQRLDPELPNVERNLARVHAPQAQGRARRRPGRGPRARAAAARRPHRRRRAPGRGPDPQPVHDRQGRGGDDRALPGGRARRASTRSSSSTPARPTAPSRSPSATAPASCTTRGTATSPRRATSSFDAATGDWVMYLDADEVLVADDAQRLRALTGRTWREAFFLDRDQPHRRHRGRHRDHARRDARVPQPPRVPLRGPHPRADRPAPAGLPARAPGAHHGARRALRLPRRRARHQGQDQPQPRAARAPGGRGRRHPVPALQPRLGVRRRRRRAARADALPRAPGRAVRETGRVSSDGYAPALAARYVHALRNTGRLAEVATAGDEVLEIFPGFTDIVLEQALAAGADRRPRARGGAAAPLPGDGRRAQPLLGDRRLRDLSRARGAGRRRCAAAAPWRRPRRRCAAACRSTPASWPPSTPTPPRCCAAGVPAAEVVETVHALVADSTPERALPARRRAERGGRRGRGRERAARGARRPSRPTPTRASRWPRPCWPRAASPTPRRVAAAVDPEAPCAAAAQRTELFARLTDGTPGRRPARALALPDEERAVFAAWQAVRSGAAAPAALPAAAAAPDPHHARRARAPAGLRCLRGPRGRARGRRHPVAPAPRGAGRPVPAPRLRRLGRRGVARGLRARRRRRAARCAAWPRWPSRGASTRTPRSSWPRPKRWPRPDPAQVLVAPAESSDNKLGHGRPGSAFHGGIERPMSFDVSPLGASPYAASSLDRTPRASESSQASFPRIGGSTRAADPDRGLGPGRRRRAPGREPDRRRPPGPLRRAQARRRRGRLAGRRERRPAAPAAAARTSSTSTVSHDELGKEQ